MSIVNEVDEEIERNSKTIDTETGVFLRVAAEYPRESIIDFAVFDEDALIGFSSKRVVVLDEINEKRNISHHISNINFQGKPKRQDYEELILGLLQVHGKWFGLTQKRFGKKDCVSVFIDAEISEKLKSWEVSNG